MLDEQRPSDEDILKHEQRIREAEVDTQPLVGALEPIESLVGEYASDSSSAPGFLGRLRCLQTSGRIAGIRRCRRDGNCFFRAFAFALVAGLAGETTPGRVARVFRLVEEYLDSAGFERSVYSDFVEAVSSDISAIAKAGAADLEERLAARWNADPYASQSAVVLLRLVTSAFLQMHEELYYPFVTSEDLPSSHSHSQSVPQTTAVSPMKAFCQRAVECIGVESDQLHIIALCKALCCATRVIYLDNSPLDPDGTPAEIIGAITLDLGDPEPIYPPSADLPFPLVQVNLLYRPGHYDLVYYTTSGG